MAVPDTATCIRLMDQHQMLDNIRHHSLVVARVADVIAAELEADQRNGEAVIDRALVLAGALLHDIAKTPCLTRGCDHAEAGGRICREHGFIEVAPIVEQHVMLADFSPPALQAGQFTAREIVYYADKRVRHHEIVSLDERLDYILEQYSDGKPEIQRLIRENFDRCRQLEKFLFARLGFTPGELEARVRIPRPTPATWDDFWA